MTKKHLVIFGLAFASSLYGEIDVGPLEWEQEKYKKVSKTPLPKHIGLYLSGDLLYLQAEENGLTFAIHQKKGSALIEDGKGQNPHFSWDFGSRVGIGYLFPRDRWDLFLDWTRFYTKASAREHAHANEEILPTWALPSTARAFSAAEADWHLALNMLDLDLSREFTIGQHTLLRPIVCLRSAWLDRSFRIHLHNDELRDKTSLKNTFWGLGPRFGLKGSFRFASDWQVFGKGTLSLLFGNGKLHQKETKKHSAEETLLYEISSSFHETTAIAEAQIGIGWDRLFMEGHTHIVIQLAWEHALFFGTNQSMHFVDNTSPATFVQNQGDLSLQGWSLRMQMKF